MQKLLITGVTGNIGSALLAALLEEQRNFEILAGVRKPEKAPAEWQAVEGLRPVRFDFADASCYENALKGVDTVFLLRPPALANVKKYFQPLIKAFEQYGVQRVMFLSVQGAEKSSIIPHRKIEKLLLKTQLDYIFLRPSYFMQNLNTTLLKDIQEHHHIFLPAGKAKFNWVDVQNIGEAGAKLLLDFEQYKNEAYEITGQELANFEEVTALMSELLDRKISYKSPNLIRFYFYKKKQGLPFGMIMVLIMLHYLPRFSGPTALTDWYPKLTAKEPTSLREFLARERASWEVMDES